MTNATQKSLFEDLKNIQIKNNNTEYFFQREYMRNKALNEEHREFLEKSNISFINPYNDKKIHSSKVNFDKLLKYDHIEMCSDIINYSNTQDFFKKWLYNIFKDTYSKILFRNLNKIKDKYDNISKIRIFVNEDIFPLYYYMQNHLNIHFFLDSENLNNQIRRERYFYKDPKEEFDLEHALKREDGSSSSPNYKIVVEFDLYNEKKIYFLVSESFTYVKKISNIKDLCFFENIRSLNVKINKLMYKNKIDRRKLIIDDIINDIYKEEIENGEIEMNDVFRSEKQFLVRISRDSYSKKGYVELSENSFIIRDEIENLVKKHLLSNYITTSKIRLPRFFAIYDFDIEDDYILLEKNMSTKKNTQSFDFLSSASIKYLNELGHLNNYKELNEKLEKIFKPMDDKFNKYNKKFSEYLYNVDRINEVYKKRKTEEEEKNKKIKDDLNNAIKNRKNKSFIDVLTTIVFKGYISNDLVSPIIELTNPKEE